MRNITVLYLEVFLGHFLWLLEQLCILAGIQYLDLHCMITIFCKPGGCPHEHIDGELKVYTIRTT
jgi:hypothetical protein